MGEAGFTLSTGPIGERLMCEQDRTPPDLLDTIGHALRCVTPQDAINWFAACGYSFI